MHGDGDDKYADAADTVAGFSMSASEGSSAVARSMEGDGLVVELNVFNADSFFSDEERVVKAVLFTRKSEVPPLWRQVAMANLRIASFGLVRHGEEDLMQRFQLTPEQLPRVIVFLPGQRAPSCLLCVLQSPSARILLAECSCAKRTIRAQVAARCSMDPTTSRISTAL